MPRLVFICMSRQKWEDANGRQAQKRLFVAVSPATIFPLSLCHQRGAFLGRKVFSASELVKFPNLLADRYLKSGRDPVYPRDNYMVARGRYEAISTLTAIYLHGSHSICSALPT